MLNLFKYPAAICPVGSVGCGKIGPKLQTCSILHEAKKEKRTLLNSENVHQNMAFSEESIKKSKPLFDLSVLLATLSGFLLVGASIFANQSSDNYTSMQNNVQQIYDNQTDSNAIEYIRISNNVLGEQYRKNINYRELFFRLGIAGICLSILSWIFGSMVYYQLTLFRRNNN